MSARPGGDGSAGLRPGRARRLASVAGALAALVVAAVVSGCAALGTERNLAPLFSEHSTAGGGTEIEALGGVLRVRRTRPGGLLKQWALRPVVIHDFQPAGDSLSRFLAPLGTSERRGDEFTWQLLPLARYQSRTYTGGESEWRFFSLPGIFWSRLRDGRTLRAVFPIAGVFEDFLSFDRLVFVVWPVFTKIERHGRTTYHFLFPVFSYTSGPGGSAWRVWPIYGRSRYEGWYDRTFVLWPIFHWQRNRLQQPPEQQELKWMVFPLVGRTSRGQYRSTTVLWPFFGWASDPETGYRAWDGPWPLVRFLRDPEQGQYRTRVWPLYSHYQGDGLDSTWYLWPIVNIREETYERATKRGLFVIPFWQRWERDDEITGRSSFQKLWPLYQLERPGRSASRFAFPALNPLWRTNDLDEMYAWIWELWRRDRDHAYVRERAWLGLYRRERDDAEDRRAIPLLWARREFVGPGGEPVVETSLLCGLVRWRARGADSLEWLPPAMPGPGWPLERVPPPPSR